MVSRKYFKKLSIKGRCQDGGLGGRGIPASSQLGHLPGTGGGPRKPKGTGGTPVTRLGFCFTLLIHCCWFFYIFIFPNKSFIFLILFYSLYSVIVLSFWLISPPHPFFFFLFSVVLLFYFVAVISIIVLFLLIYILSFYFYFVFYFLILYCSFFSFFFTYLFF